MEKAALRKKYIAARREFSDNQISKMSEKIFKNFLQKFVVSRDQNVHIFLSINKLKEVDTQLFIHYFQERGAKIFVPKMIKGKLIAVELKGTEYLVENSFGILEPVSNVNECSSFDIVITPLLYSDALGNRVGYGKGYYDAFFAAINVDAVKIGVGFFSPEEDISNVSPQDISLDYLLLPDSILSFSGLEKKSKK